MVAVKSVSIHFLVYKLIALREGITLINPLVMAGFLVQDLGMTPDTGRFFCMWLECPVRDAKLPPKTLKINTVCQVCGQNGDIGEFTPEERLETPINWDEGKKVTISGTVPK